MTRTRERNEYQEGQFVRLDFPVSAFPDNNFGVLRGDMRQMPVGTEARVYQVSDDRLLLLFKRCNQCSLWSWVWPEDVQPTQECHFSALKIGQQFRFKENQDGHPWEYRGNGWYGWAYSGGPYHIQCPESCVVIPLSPLEYIAQPE